MTYLTHDLQEYMLAAESGTIRARGLVRALNVTKPRIALTADIGGSSIISCEAHPATI